MSDKLTVTLVVVFLGAFALLIGAGAIYLTNTDHNVPGELWTLAGAAVGSLGSILARTSTEGVRINNPPSQPVPTEDVAA